MTPTTTSLFKFKCKINLTACPTVPSLAGTSTHLELVLLVTSSRQENYVILYSLKFIYLALH